MQMQGRAGRRGFDDEGYVIFYGMTKSRVKALVTSNLPDLIGNIPMSPTMYSFHSHFLTIIER